MEQGDIIKKLFESNCMLNDSMGDLISAYRTSEKIRDELCKNYDALAQRCFQLQQEIMELKLENREYREVNDKLHSILERNHIEY